MLAYLQLVRELLCVSYLVEFSVARSQRPVNSDDDFTQVDFSSVHPPSRCQRVVHMRWTSLRTPKFWRSRRLLTRPKVHADSRELSASRLCPHADRERDTGRWVGASDAASAAAGMHCAVRHVVYRPTVMITSVMTAQDEC